MSNVGIALAQPSDLRKFIEQREACDHWRGESGYDDERQLQINRAVCETCPGTDAQLRRLKLKYARNADAMKALEGFDQEIEAKDKKAVRRFCDQANRGVLPK